MLYEVAMLHNKTFEHLKLSFQDIKATTKFGGMSIILSGDLL